MGAVSESRRMCAGWEGTSWYVPGTGSPVLGFVSYTPAGMTQVAIAARTISANRIVYAEGSVKTALLLRFGGFRRLGSDHGGFRHSARDAQTLPGPCMIRSGRLTARA